MPDPVAVLLLTTLVWGVVLILSISQLDVRVVRKGSPDLDPCDDGTCPGGPAGRARRVESTKPTRGADVASTSTDPDLTLEKGRPRSCARRTGRQGFRWTDKVRPQRACFL